MTNIMDNLNKLYNLRESLKDAGVSIPDELLQKIALQEKEVILSKLTDFQFAADLLFEDIESPYEVIVKYDPKTGVAVLINHNNALSKPSSSNRLTKDEINTPALFIKYIYGLDVGVKTKQDYIRCIDDDSIVNWEKVNV